MVEFNDELEPWMASDARATRKFIKGKNSLIKAFVWHKTKQGMVYWCELSCNNTTFSDLSEEDQAYVQLIASADGG